MEETTILEELQLQTELLVLINESIANHSLQTSSGLDSIGECLASAEYYQYMYDTASILQEYLLQKENGGSSATPEDTEQLTEIYTVLTSINEKMQTAEQNQESLDAIVSINENAEASQAHLQNLENIQVLVLCGVGMVFGAICTLILSRFLHH